MQKINFSVFFVLVGIAASIFAVQGCKERKADVGQVEIVQKDTVPPMGFWPDSLDMTEGTVHNGEAFISFLHRLGISHSDAHCIAQACDTVFDVRKLRAGNKFRAYHSSDTTASGGQTIEYLVYDNSKVSMTIFKCTAPFSVRVLDKPVERELTAGDVVITSSLWNDMIAADISPLLIVSLSEIYAWTVDFFGLQEGDRFRVLYQQEKCDGEIVAVDSVYYAEFIRDSAVLKSICFDQGDGGNLYWNSKGESMRKAFLKAPLKFSRISSGFSYRRRHPVSGKVKAHTAVDYAAPTGTPVMSIGDGTVISAGWSGGGGNTVKIRHNSVYTTAYLHLSRYAKGIKSGARVRQGDVIGYVGSTGVSTGPHLDFRVWKNGTPINPLKMEAPPSEPLRKENLPALDSTSLHYKHLLDSLIATR